MEKTTFIYKEYVIYKYETHLETERDEIDKILDRDNTCYTYYKHIDEFTIYEWDKLPPDENALIRLTGYNEMSSDDNETDDDNSSIMDFSVCYTFWFSREDIELIDNDFVTEGYDSPIFKKGTEPEEMEVYQGVNELKMFDGIAADMDDGLDLDDILDRRSSMFIGRYKYGLEKYN